MDRVDLPVAELPERLHRRLQHFRGIFEVRLALLVYEEVGRIVGQFLKEREQRRDLVELRDARLQNRVEHGPRLFRIAEHRAVIRHRVFAERLRVHAADVFAVEPQQLIVVENGRRLADAVDRERLFELLEREDLLVVLRAPAEQRDVVCDDRGEVALVEQALEARRAVALRELRDGAVLVLAHDQRQMHVGRLLPAERLVKQVVLRRRGQVLAAAHDVRDVHQVVVDDVCEIVRRVAVRLQQDLVLDLLVLDRDRAVHRVLKRGRAVERHFLADDVRRAGVEQPLHLLGGQVAAVAVVAAEGVRRVDRLQPLLRAEAVVRLALPDELLRVGLVKILALALDIRAVCAADVGAFVVLEADLLQRAVDHVGRALHIALLVRVLNAQHKGAALRFCDEILVQRRPEIADVHEAGRARRKACAYHKNHQSCQNTKC